MRKKLVSRQQQESAWRWRKHLEAVKKIGGVSDEAMSLANSHVKADNIGFEQGEIRPDEKLGQWDLYYSLLYCNIPPDECLLLSGLSASEIAEQNRREELENAGIDPDNVSEVAQFERLEAMSPDDLSVEITRLEKALGIQSL